jgi:ABC-type nitrate/sulfonate/bicarbonate transport system substrate-binding protein
VSFAGFDTAFTQLYVAKINGYFDAVNLDVQIKNFGANVITGMVSGQLDLAFQGANSAMLPVRDGADTTVIYNNVGGGVSAFVYGGVPKVKTISDCTRMGSSPVGTSAYGWAVAEKKLFNGNWLLVPGDNPITVASLASGAIDCATGAPGGYSDLAVAGKARLLLNPKDPGTFPPGTLPSSFDFLEAAIFGMKANIQKKQDAVVRFLKAYQRAVADVRSQTPEQLAATLKKNADWGPFDAAKLKVSIGLVQSFYAPHDGYIPESVWPGSLQFYSLGGSTFIDPSDSKWSYKNRVDMSYYVKAVGKPKS